MPARTEARTPAGHSLALFSKGHTAHNEVDHALALTADPGAAGDIHRFRLSMRRKQELFTRMRDLDIAWNDCHYHADLMYIILQNLGLTIVGSELTWTTWMASRRYPFRPGLGRPFRHVTFPWNAPYCMTKNAEARSASIVKIVIRRDSVRGPTSYACIPRAAMSRSVTRVLTIRVQPGSYRPLAQYPTIGLTQHTSLD
ncbi:hypothetical protein EDB87DRAFT_1580854 [Lactarius vividus]|nr:hypothetical protein EDB87DRAFT_1580854 [Lactarius vividus]